MGLKSRSVLYYQAEMASVCGKRLCIQTFAIHFYTWTYFQLESKKGTSKTANIMCHQNVTIYMEKFAVLLLNWNFSCLIQVYNINCLYLFSGIKRIFYCSVCRRESWGSWIVREEIKIRAFWKVVRTSFHCTWSDINTVNAGTCWQFYPNFLVRISFTRILRLTIRDIF